jgi:cell division protein FtsI/penicillin-binding protein 2
VAARAFARVAPARAKIAFYIVSVLAMFLCWRLADVQVRQGPRLAALALDQHAESVELFAKRGSIVDRDGNVLVRSLPSESIYAVPTNIVHPAQVAAKLAPILGLTSEALSAALAEKSQFRWLARKIPHDVAKRVRALDIDGIAIIPEETGVRFAPEGHALSTALGFVGIDENGLDGLEYSFDSFLRGTPGKMRIEADQFGRAIPFGDRTILEKAHPGGTLQLTIDSYLQFEAERARARGPSEAVRGAQRRRDRDGSLDRRSARARERPRFRSGAFRGGQSGCAARSRGGRCLRARFHVQARDRDRGARIGPDLARRAVSGARFARGRRQRDP